VEAGGGGGEAGWAAISFANIAVLEWWGKGRDTERERRLERERWRGRDQIPRRLPSQLLYYPRDISAKSEREGDFFRRRTRMKERLALTLEVRQAFLISPSLS